jgi:nitrite reductase (NADH) small subunit
MHFADLAQGRPCEVMVAGRPVVLALVGDTVHAVVGTCPHAGGPLAEGTLVGTTLTCPMHGWSFDLVTGSCHVNPEDRIGILRVHVADGVVHVGDGVAA